MAADSEMENEYNVILCGMLPIPRTLPGTRTESPSFEYAAIFLMFTTFFADVVPRAILATLDQMGASLPRDALSRAPTVLLIDGLTLIVYAPDQEIKFEAYAKLGIGVNHAKWNSSNIATLVEGKSDDERILSIESTGALSPEQILLAGIEQLGLNLSVFKDIIQQTS